MATNQIGIDQFFVSLAGFDWGADASFLAAIDALVVAAAGDPDRSRDLERRFNAVLAADTSRAAKEYACRRLCLIGTTASVPGLAALLGEPEHSHMARFALERIDAAEAAEALREAVGHLSGKLRIGMISSLAARRDAAAVPVLAPLVRAGEPELASAATFALGRIGTTEAAAALAAADDHTSPISDVVFDARISCAEQMLADGDRPAAQAVYRSLVAAGEVGPDSRRERAARFAARSGLIDALDDT